MGIGQMLKFGSTSHRDATEDEQTKQDAVLAGYENSNSTDQSAGAAYESGEGLPEPDEPSLQQPDEPSLQQPEAAATPLESWPATPDVTDLLKKVGDLHDSGVLTDAEFATKKADLLGRL